LFKINHFQFFPPLFCKLLTNEATFCPKTQQKSPFINHIRRSPNQNERSHSIAQHRPNPHRIKELERSPGQTNEATASAASRVAISLENQAHLAQGITGAAARSRQPVLIEDTDAAPRYIAAHPNIHSEAHTP
jgi:hypothetical protein